MTLHVASLRSPVESFSKGEDRFCRPTTKRYKLFVCAVLLRVSNSYGRFAWLLVLFYFLFECLGVR